MVHPVGFAGYGFQAADGRTQKGEGTGLAAIQNLPSGRPAVLGAPAATRIRERRGQSIMKRVVGAFVHLYCGRGDCRQDF